MTKQVRVRFAPSPTGYMHIGNFRAAIFNWLFARHHSGTFLVRIEDTDKERSKEQYTDAIRATLAWADIEPDEQIVIQSESIAQHKAVLETLLAEGKAYRCYCTQDEIGARAVDQAFIKYDGHCAGNKQQLDKPFVVRFRLPEFTEIAFNDLIRGTVRFERDQLDDFIIARSDGTPMYNFVVVVDDAQMAITHVIRGEDHISNTPKQILLAQACGYPVPEFAHLPMILGPSGDRLSKRDGATSVIDFKDAGYLPDALINYLVRLGWSHGDQEIFSRDELIDLFTLNAVGKKGSIFDKDKLNWVNAVYIKAASGEQLLNYLLTYIDADLERQLSAWSRETIIQGIELYKERVSTMRELLDELILLHDGPATYTEADRAKWITDQTKEHLDNLMTELKSLDAATEQQFTQLLKSFAKEQGVKFVVIAQPIRIAFVGKSAGPSLFGLFELLGNAESIARLERLRNNL